jgi:hypothetical protein
MFVDITKTTNIGVRTTVQLLSLERVADCKILFTVKLIFLHLTDIILMVYLEVDDVLDNLSLFIEKGYKLPPYDKITEWLDDEYSPRLFFCLNS